MARLDQINVLLQQELADLILRYVDLDGVMITVTSVICSPDLKRAKIMVSVLPDKYFGTALTTLRSQSKLLRKKLAERIKIKFVPKLAWEIDDMEKRAAEIEAVVKQL